MVNDLYNELMQLSKDYNDNFNSLYRLHTYNEDEINNIFQVIKRELIQSKMFLPSQLLKILSTASKYNCRYFKSYWSLFKKLYEEYHPRVPKHTSIPFLYFLYKEFGILIDYDIVKLESQNFSLDVHEKDSIHSAIMTDDKELFISLTEKEGFNERQNLKSEFYPESKYGYSLLELCCYHGAVNCFKFLRTKFKPLINSNCLKLSFLGGNPDIINECLKETKPYDSCMEYAIISHNIDFVTYLMNEHNLKIEMEYCHKYNNLQAFLVYLDTSKNYKKCFPFSVRFNFPSLCEYLISHGVDINTRDKNYYSAFFHAAQYGNRLIAEFLISHNINMDNCKSNFQIAVQSDNKDIAELLISRGIDVNTKFDYKKTALHYAALSDCAETVKMLISHGININDVNELGETALHYATYYDNIETVKILLESGANINTKKNTVATALHNAVDLNIEIAKLLIAHGADVNTFDNNSKTLLHKAAQKIGMIWLNFLYQMELMLQ
ncbi:proteasome regulatory particle assembly [Trichomonas vaginalis G3]|uniref:proteasome regulatory particle assembly n=1 Tax=Trichomonas vaginalis (strain ATCC PRA-98 / G3) TaxID=412133 RepID=UPI0021E5F5E5|nr:proteasome regulatory particle assembly [Trichomonas vaginalis G3]KAI5537068.1 proteasome regulatory particle assembly [Trichomonas vaginalis G3]